METFKQRQDITSLIKIICEEQEIPDYSVVDVYTNQKGEGFLSQFFLFTIRNNATGKRLDIALKSAFMDDKVRNMMPIRKSFENETFFYSRVYPTLKKFERDHGILQTVEFVPKCYKVSTIEKSEMLALENLRTLGFEVFNKKNFLDDEHISLMFKTYGRFHAYSFALRDQQPKEYEELIRNFSNVYLEVFLLNDDFYAKFMRELFEQNSQYLIPGQDDEIITKFQKYRNDGVNTIFKEIVTENCDYPAILHGDCWSNNMMFKYEINENGKKLTEIRLIDWQVIKTGSPVCDLSYALYSGTSNDITDNLDKYLKIYHDSFSSFLKELGSDPEKLFPFKTLQAHWKKYAKFGFIMSCNILKMKMSNSDEIVDFTDGLDSEGMSEVYKNISFDEDRYKKTIRGLLYHLSKIEAL